MLLYITIYLDYICVYILYILFVGHNMFDGNKNTIHLNYFFYL